jgi:hypothetical protein
MAEHVVGIIENVLSFKPWFFRYEKSYMHRDVVTHVAVSPADFFITGSTDGKTKDIR